MILIKDKRQCVGCGNCVQVCPVNCIRFLQDTEGFYYPETDMNVCINCGSCHKVCPVEYGTMVGDANFITKSLGAYHKDIDIRMKSTSGGVFTALATDILNHHGIVYGASMDDNYHVKHIAIRSITELPKLRGSKYVQSEVVGIFPVLKKELEDGCNILFSGTPCQVKALYAYLGNRPQRLLTVEVVCLGVPSPMVFERYIKEEKAIGITFRRKERSWIDYDVELTLSNGHIRRQRAASNPYIRGFLQYWSLRPSCSLCPAKAFTSGADITMGDFWGVGRVAPGLSDNKGTSIVFLHTNKGKEVWQRIRSELQYAEVPVEEAMMDNPTIIKSVTFPKERDAFFKDLEHKTVRATLNKYSGEKFPNTAKRHILKVWNLGWNSALRMRNVILVDYDWAYSVFHTHPIVVGIEDTLRQINNQGFSVSRFGDGELKLIRGEQTWFQDSHPVLRQKLQEILKNQQENLLVCVPNIFGPLTTYTDENSRYWQLHISRNRRDWYRYMNMGRTYYDAFISRCYMPYRDKSRTVYIFNLWKELWNGRHILVIEGEKTRLGVGNDLLSGALSVKRILCPNTQAFDYYDKLLYEAQRYDCNHLVLLALGPTATVLAANLCNLGYQAIDIGHLDIEYEWFLMGAVGKVPVPDKFVNEAGAGHGVGDCSDSQYLNEIVCRC